MTLLGGYGNDKLKGDMGDDSFVFNIFVAFNSEKIGIDTIVDFGDGTDVIVLDKTTFTALSSQAGAGFSQNDEFAVVQDDSLVDSRNAHILYSSSTGNLFYNESGNGADLTKVNHFATLSNAIDLVADNFHISD